MEAPDTNPKTAVGRLKPQLHAIPPSALIALGLAMEDGLKHGLMEWRGQTVNASDKYNKILRHALSWWDGQDATSDSKVSNLASIMGNCAVLIDAEICGTLNDDRPMVGPVADMIAHVHEQRMNAAVQSVLPTEPVADLMGQFYDGYGWNPPYADEPVGGINLGLFPFWKNLFPSKPKETPMATELETIIAAVHRSEATSERTILLVQSLSAKLDSIRQNTTDPATRAQLLALATELDTETDKVEAADTQGDLGLDPVVVTVDSLAPAAVDEPVIPVSPDVPVAGIPAAEAPVETPVADPTLGQPAAA